MEKRELDDTEIELLARYGLKDLDRRAAVCLTFEQQEYMLREGGPIDYLYIVVSGKAKVCLSVSSGKQLLLSYFMSTGIVGEAELMTDSREAYSAVQAVSRLTCIGLPLSVYAEALKSSLAFVNYAARELAKKLARCSMNGAITILQPLEARLCAYILQTADGGVFRDKHTEVAELVGTSYRHLMRSIDRLCSEGILLKEPSGLRIADLPALSRKAGDLYIT